MPVLLRFVEVVVAAVALDPMLSGCAGATLLLGDADGDSPIPEVVVVVGVTPDAVEVVEVAAPLPVIKARYCGR